MAMGEDMGNPAHSVDNGPNILIVGQSGRLQYEALIFAASLFANSPSTPR